MASENSSEISLFHSLHKRKRAALVLWDSLQFTQQSGHVMQTKKTLRCFGRIPKTISRCCSNKLLQLFTLNNETSRESWNTFNYTVSVIQKQALSTLNIFLLHAVEFPDNFRPKDNWKSSDSNGLKENSVCLPLIALPREVRCKREVEILPLEWLFQNLAILSSRICRLG